MALGDSDAAKPPTTTRTQKRPRKRVGWKPVALDGGYGWVVVFGSFLIHVFADGFVYSFGVIAESLIKVGVRNF